MYGSLALECWSRSEPSVTVRIERYESVNFSAAWDYGFTGCAPKFDKTIPPTSTTEVAAYEVAEYTDYGDGPDVRTLYDLCATNNPSDSDLSRDSLSESQRKEVRGMLTLCPDHPLAAQYESAVERSAAAEKAESDAAEARAAAEQEEFDAMVAEIDRKNRADAEAGFATLPQEVITYLDRMTADRDPTYLAIYCMDFENAATVLASGPGATPKQVDAYLSLVCLD